MRKFIEEKFIEKETKYLEPEIDKYVTKPERAIKTEVGQLMDDVKKPTLIKTNKQMKKSESKKEKSIEKEEFIEQPIQLRISDRETAKKINKEILPDTYIREKYVITKNFPKLRLISYTGQLSNNTYIVLEGLNEDDESGLFIMDQHAASERINKEYYLNMYENSKGSKQQLIVPLKINVSASEKFFLEENMREINKLGFNFEHFGGNTFILREIPTIIDKLPKIDVIKEIISDITEIGKEKSFTEVKEDIVNYIACHRSIRGGDELTSLKDVRNLIVELANCKDPFHCAHGRPTLRFISFKELDKLFKRKV